jgi:hypothetical protein
LQQRRSQHRSLQHEQLSDSDAMPDRDAAHVPTRASAEAAPSTVPDAVPGTREANARAAVIAARQQQDANSSLSPAFEDAVWLPALTNGLMPQHIAQDLDQRMRALVSLGSSLDAPISPDFIGAYMLSKLSHCDAATVSTEDLDAVCSQPGILTRTHSTANSLAVQLHRCPVMQGTVVESCLDLHLSTSQSRTALTIFAN